MRGIHSIIMYGFNELTCQCWSNICCQLMVNKNFTRLDFFLD